MERAQLQLAAEQLNLNELSKLRKRDFFAHNSRGEKEEEKALLSIIRLGNKIEIMWAILMLFVETRFGEKLHVLKVDVELVARLTCRIRVNV